MLRAFPHDCRIAVNVVCVEIKHFFTVLTRSRWNDTDMDSSTKVLLRVYFGHCSEGLKCTGSGGNHQMFSVSQIQEKQTVITAAKCVGFVLHTTYTEQQQLSHRAED